MNRLQQKRAEDIAKQVKDLLQLDSCHYSQPKKDKERVRFQLKLGDISLSVPIAKNVVFNQFDFTPTILETIISMWIAKLEYQQRLLDGDMLTMLKLAGAA